jgi:hypothetical protein
LGFPDGHELKLVLPVFAWMITPGNHHMARLNGETKSIRSNHFIPWSDGRPRSPLARRVANK